MLLVKTIQGAENNTPDLIEFGYGCGDGYSTTVRRFLIIIHHWGGGVNGYYFDLRAVAKSRSEHPARSETGLRTAHLTCRKVASVSVGSAL